MYLAYVYRLTHKITKEFYIGYRYANIKLQIQPEDDLGVTYFTSSEYIGSDEFHEYESEIIFKTADPDEAYDRENMLISENWGDPLLLNKHWQSENKRRFKVTEEGVAKLRQTNKNKKWYNNGITEVHKHSCPEGFIPGRLVNPFPKQSGYTKGYVCYNNGFKEIMLPPNVEPTVGFVKGKLPASAETNKKISNTLKGKAHATGKKWYTDGNRSVLSFECPEGYRPGHSNGSGNSHLNRDYSGYRWYTDGNKSVRAKMCPDGYYPGRTITAR
jgi:hypothetical protein